MPLYLGPILNTYSPTALLHFRTDPHIIFFPKDSLLYKFIEICVISAAAPNI
jgi:hypothetical protein